MKCENQYCNNECPEDNEDRVCAYQIDDLTPCPDYKNVPTCNCCDKCREVCRQGKFEEENI